VNLQGIRRNIKNVAHNYTDAQVKVREATSNDPWGPSSTMMSEIADLTYNVAAFSEIMQMVWKRLNDHGKNWRHVYKALVLLEYLIKTGSEKVAQQCKENIYAIQTLKDFQYLDENKDQGINVREKAKAVVALLKDDDRLKNERVRALKAKERFAQAAAGIGSDTVYNGVRGGGGGGGGSDRFDGTGGGGGPPSRMREMGGGGGSPTDPAFEVPASEIEAARPQTAGEEELQLQLALAMSREEAGQEETKNKSDDVGLQLALQKSKETAKTRDGEDVKGPGGAASGGGGNSSKPSTDLLDLADVNFGNPILPASMQQQSAQPAPPQRTAASADPWGAPPAPAAIAAPSVPSSAAAAANNDPWGTSPVVAVAAAPAPAPPPQANDPWAIIQPPPQNPRTASPAFGGNNVAAAAATAQPSAIPAYNDPWNPAPAGAAAPAAAATALSKPDSFSPAALRSTHSPAAATATAATADNDPWLAPSNAGLPAMPAPASGNNEQSIDPFSPVAQNQLAEFDLLRDQMEKPVQPTLSNNGGTVSPNPFDLGGLQSTLEPTVNGSNNMMTGTKPKKAAAASGGVHAILGEHSNLVNLDELVSSAGKQPVRNPFEQQPPNPFQAAKAPKPAMNDLLQQQNRSGTGWSQPPQQQQQQQDFFDAWK